jgi:CRP/FNR family cyclic AMP-dependent transcriptional regulator
VHEMPRSRQTHSHSHLFSGRTTAIPVGLWGSEAARNSGPRAEEIDPFYLFARFLDWEQHQESTAAWDLLGALDSSHQETRAHARSLLASSEHFGGDGLSAPARRASQPKTLTTEESMKAPYGIELDETCTTCEGAKAGFFCGFSRPALEVLDEITHKSTLPAGAILYVEGQSPRGMFILCSGRVNLSTTSREGKTLILKTAGAGEVLGLSAAVSGLGYETTAETATPCQLSFIDRKHLLELMQTHPEVSMQTVRSLSREYHFAYRDIRDLVLTRTSTGRLARLLLAQSSPADLEAQEARIPSPMTHEEMAHRIGSSRETVTRLISDLKRRHLIRLEGPTLVINNRMALEALAM